MLNGILPTSWTGYTHALLRITAGLAFMQHGTAKLFNFPDISAMLQGMPSAMITGTGLVDFLGGAIIILGAYTRVTAFVLAGYMAAAYLIAHLPMSFFPIQNFGEPAYLFCFIFLWLATAGAGIWSVDAARKG